MKTQQMNQIPQVHRQKSSSSGRFLASTLLAFGITAASLHAQTIYNFSTGGYSGAGADTGGATSETWNTLTRNATTSSIKDSKGNATSLTFTDKSPGSYSTAAAAIPLFTSYFLESAATPSVITNTINNVPAGVYNLYLYSQNGNFGSRGASFIFNGVTNTVLNNGNNSTFSFGKNYTAFTALTVPAGGGSITFAYTTNSTGTEADFCGVQLVSVSGLDTWAGNTSSNFSASANWTYFSGSGPVAAGDALVFGAAGTAGTALTNDLVGAAFSGITFSNGASAFTLYGNDFTLGNTSSIPVLTSWSSSAQVISNNITLGNAPQVITVGSGGNVTLNGNLSGASTKSGLILNGSGVLTLGGINTYSNVTAIIPSYTWNTTTNAGELVGVTGGSCSNSIVTVSQGGTNGVSILSANGQWFCAGLTNSGNPGYMDFNIGSVGLSATKAPLQVNGPLVISSNLKIIVRGTASLGLGQYPLIKYTGTLSGTPPTAAFSLPAGLVASISNNTANTSIDLVVSGSSVYWAVGGGNWDKASQNWKNTASTGVTNATYADGDAVTFDDSTGGNSPYLVTNTVTVSPLSVTVNSTNSYTITGSSAIAGSATLTKSGSGTLTISSPNTFTGSTTINSNSAVILSGAGTLGTNTAGLTMTSASLDLGGSTLVVNGAVSCANSFPASSGTLVTNIGSGLANWIVSITNGSISATNYVFNYDNTVAGATNTIVAANLGGTGGLLKSGAAALGLNVSNSYSGGTLLSGSGTIYVGNNYALGTGPVTNTSTGYINVNPNVTVSGLTYVAGSGSSSGGLGGQGTWAGNVVLSCGKGQNPYIIPAVLGLDASTYVTNTTGEAMQIRSGSLVTINSKLTGSSSYTNGVFTNLYLHQWNVPTAGNLTINSTANDFNGEVQFEGYTITVKSLANQGSLSSLGTNGTIHLGNCTLKYAGAGPATTDRTIDLFAGNNLTTYIDQSGTSGLLKFTSPIVTYGDTATGTKTLQLQGSTAGTGEWDGVIPDSSFVGSTPTTQNILPATNTITLGSVVGITVGAAISGAGPGAGTTITAINGNVVTLSAVTTNLATINSPVAMTIPGVINPISLTKAGTGTWTLGGQNTYSGVTTVSAGELIGNTGGSSSNSIVTVSAGATNGVSILGANGQWFCAGLTNSTSTGYMDFNIGSIGLSATKAPLQVNGPLVVSSNLKIIVRGTAAILNGQYPLIKYTGTLSGTPPTTALSLPSGVVASISNNTANSSIDLVVTGATPVYWAVGSGNWDINTSQNWKNTASTGVTNAYYVDGETVTFDDSTGGNSPYLVTNAVTVSPASVTVNTTNSYTIAGSAIAGTASLTKSGAGTLTLTNANTYSGGTTLAGGTLYVANNNALGTGPVTNKGAYTLNLNDGISVTGLTYYPNAAGAPSLAKGAGSGTSTWAGNINVAMTSGNGAYFVNNQSGTLVIGNDATTYVTNSAGGIWFSRSSGSVTINSKLTGGTLTSSGNGAGYLRHFAGNGGTLTINSTANDFNGDVNIWQDTVAVKSLANIGTVSSLGTNGTFYLGNGATTGTLKYLGSGAAACNHPLNLPGTTGGGVLDQSGTSGLLLYNGTFAASGAGSKTLTLQGSTAGTGEIDSAIVDNLTGTYNTSLTKSGTGLWTLAGINTYSGTTAISAGELVGSTTGSSASSAATVSNGATNGVQLATAGGQWSWNGLTFNSGTTYADFDFNSFALSTTTAPLNAGALVNSGTVKVILRNVTIPATVGNYPLIHYTGTDPLVGGFSLNTALPLVTNAAAGLVVDTVNKNVAVGVKLVVPNLAFTNALGVSRQITVSDIQAAGLASSAGSPVYTITLPSATSAQGGGVITNGTGKIILYTPTGSPSSDSFSYTVNDGNGATATATVNITFGSVAGSQIDPGSISTVGGYNQFTFHGIPSTDYHVQVATTLSPTPDWTNADSGVTTGANGSFLWTDPVLQVTRMAATGQVYYRISYP